MAYIQAAIVTIFLLACILIGYMVFTFDSQHELNVALESFLKGDAEESERILTKLEKDLPPAKYHLYHAYVSRDKKQLADSNRHLQKAAEASQDKNLKPDIILEIFLNQAFNAYLNRDPKGIAEAVNQAQEIAGSDNEWVLLFTGIFDFSHQNYSKTLNDWQAASEKKPSSAWMKKAFDQTFTPFWFATRLARSEIEEGKYLKAREILEQAGLTASEDQHNEINFLMGLSYVKEAQDKPINAAQPYYKLAFSYFKRVPMQNELFVEEWKKVANRLQNDLFTLIDQRSFQDIPFYISALENWEAAPELDRVSKRLVALLDQEISRGNWKMVQELTVILNRVLKPGGMRKNLENRFQALVENSLVTGDFSHIEQYWQAALMFSAHPDSLSENMADLVQAKILELLPLDDSDLTLTHPDFMFWQRIESSPQARFAFAKGLVDWADTLWIQNHQEEKAVALMKTALSTIPLNDHKSLLMLIEDQIARHYEAVLQQDSIAQLPYILEAVHQLKLTGINIQDKREIERQLEEADASFANKFYPEATMKAAWVLRIAPKNQKAMQIIGLVNYREGEYTQALPYLKAISLPDQEVNEALAVCEILKGDDENGRRLLDEMAKEQAISREAYLNLGYQALINHNLQEGLQWLSKIVPQDNEALAGISFAHYLLEEWEQASSTFDQLTDPYNKLWGLQGAAVLSRVNLGQLPQAEEALSNLLASNQEPKDDFPLLFTLFKKKHLDQVDRHFIAANFYKGMKKEYPKALHHFNKIDNPNPTALLAFAETYLVLNQKDEALKILERFYERVKDNTQDISLEQKALPLLGSLYFAQMLYPDAVKVFSRYFSIEPNTMDHRALYAKALMDIRRYDLALEQYQLLEKANKLNHDHTIALVDCLIHTDHFDQANALASSLLAYNPPLSIYDRLKIGNLMIITGDEPLFQASLQNIPASNQLSEKNSQELIRIRSSQGDYEQAAKIAKLHKEELKNASGLMTLAHLEAGQSHIKEALQFAHRAEQLSPNDMSIGDFIGLYERDPDYFTQSLQALRKKMDANPQRISLQIAYARNLIDFVIENQNQGITNSSDLQQALNVLDKLSLYAQEIPEVFCLTGQAYLLSDRHTAASEAFRSALRLDRSYADAYKYLALVQEDPKQAIHLLKDALKFTPNDAESWQQIGLLYESQGDDVDAISSYKKAIKYRPNDPAAYIPMAQLSLQVNQPGDAKTALEKVLVLEPANILALKLLLMALYDPTLHYGNNNLLPLVTKQQTVYKTLHDLAPQEAEALSAEFSMQK